MFLFNHILKDLKNVKHVHPQFNDEEANVMFYCCRQPGAYEADIPMLEHVQARGLDYYKLPTGATVLTSYVTGNAVPFMKRIDTARINERMNPMLAHELHVTTQGCLYNLLTYYGIFTAEEGDIMTAMQATGVTSRQFVNLMHKHDQLLGVPQHRYLVVREPIQIAGGATEYLRQFMVALDGLKSQGYSDSYTYALFLKLYPLNYKPGTNVHSEVGHWVSISLSQIHGWRFIDPQALSVSPQGITVPVTHFPISTEQAFIEVFRRISTGFEAIDFIFVEPCEPGKSGNCSNITCFHSLFDKAHIQTRVTARQLQGGKNARKTRSKSKSRPKYNNKSRPNRNRNRTKCNRK
jgi:hypothetical protein